MHKYGKAGKEVHKASFTLSLDPNDIGKDEDSDDEDGLHQKHPVEYLEQQLNRYPNEYFECEITRENWYCGHALILNDCRYQQKYIYLPTTVSCGRTFNGDRVVVQVQKIFEEGFKHDMESTGCIGKGIVVGVLERCKGNIHEKRFICRVDDNNCSLMIPLEDKSVKIFVVSPHRRFSRNQVSLYKCNKRGKGCIEIENTENKLLQVKNHESHRLLPQLFSVRYLSWSKSRWHPKGYVEKILDNKDSSPLKVLLNQFEIFKSTLGHKSIEMANCSPAIASRKDLTDLFVFTIDDDKTSIRDDGLSIEKCKKHEDCWKIGVHIAEIGSSIEVGGELDEEAQRHMESCEEIIDGDPSYGKMLPRELTANYSLSNDGAEKFAVSTFFHSGYPPLIIYPGKTTEDEVPEIRPMLSKIKVKHNLSYTEAQNLIRSKKKKKKQNFSEGNKNNIAQQLYYFWQVMWKFRFLRLDSAAFYEENLGFGEGSSPSDKCMSRMLVEEAMITVNAYTACFLKHHKIPYFARTLPKPQLRDMKLTLLSSLSPYQESFHLFYKSLNWEYRKALVQFHQKMMITKKTWKEIQTKLNSGRIEEAIFLACCDHKQPEFGKGLASFHSAQQKVHMQSSEYVDASDLLHFRLRVTCYTQCTSPLRRYVDLDTQRRLVNFLIKTANQNGPVSYVCESSQPTYDDDQPLPVDITSKILMREENLKRLKVFMKHLEAEDNFAVVTEGHILKVDELDMHVFFSNFNLVTFANALSFPLSELGPTKRVKEGRLDWTLRFYNIATQERLDQKEHLSGAGLDINSHFRRRSCISTEKWKLFLKNLNGNTLTNEGLRACKKSLQEVCDSISESPDDLHVVGGALKTSNGVHHGRKVQVSVGFDLGQKKRWQRKTEPTLQASLYFQFGFGIENSAKTVVAQLLLLNATLERSEQGMEVCLLHRRHATMFDIDCKELALSKEDFDEYNYGRTSFVLFLYYEKWLPIVTLDGIFSSVHNNDSFTLQLENVTMRTIDNETTGEFTLGKLFCENCFVSIRKGDYLCLRKRNGMGAHMTISIGHGVVVESRENDPRQTSNVYKFKVFTSIESSSLRCESGDVIACEVIPLSVPHRRMLGALNSLPSANSIVKAICTDDVNRGVLREQLECDVITRSTVLDTPTATHRIPGFPHPLNQKQREQITKARNQRFTLIQGPPGTGKSYMGAHLAYYFAKLNKDLERKYKKVLYCGPSNKSVDVVAKYLQCVPSVNFMRVYGGMYEEKDFPIPVKPTRFDGVTTTIPPSLRKNTLHHAIRQPGKKFAAQIQKYDEQFKSRTSKVTIEDCKKYQALVHEAKLEELKDVEVILSTCTVAGGFLLKEFEYAQCIIDECGMCSEPETLIPIMTVTAKTEDPQITLIGDHKQLQPVIMCRAAAKRGLDKSLFERLHTLAGTLTRQYRMDEMICQFPSLYFYGNQLETDLSVLNRRKGILHYPWNVKTNVAVFCDVRGCEEEDSSKSKFNRHQVKVVIKVLLHLFNNSVKSSQIMVLSPYLAQCRHLMEAIKHSGQLKQHNAGDIHVGSVATSQGSEADYVILSTVRSSNTSEADFHADQHWLKRHIGFVTDDHQINVAITRAKLGLMIVGNRKLLAHYETWREMLKEFEFRRAIMLEADLRDWSSDNDDDDDSDSSIYPSDHAFGSSDDSDDEEEDYYY